MVVWGFGMGGGVAAAGEVTLVVTDSGGVGGRVGAPVSTGVDLGKLFEANVNARRVDVVETAATADPENAAVPVQFEPDPKQTLGGTLWWLMPPG